MRGIKHRDNITLMLEYNFRKHNYMAIYRETNNLLTLKVPEKLQLYGPHVCYVVHICDFGMLRVK